MGLPLGRWAVVPVLALVSVLLAGCGSNNDGGGLAPSSPQITVLVMRHCARSTVDDGITAVPGFSYFNNYSAQPWPVFGVPLKTCLPRGMKLVEAEGTWLKKYGKLPTPWMVISDDSERDKQSGASLLRGFGLEAGNMAVSSGPFHAADSPGCPKITPAQRAAAIQAQIEVNPMPKGTLAAILAKEYQALGVGAAGDWQTKPCAVNKATGSLEGSCSAASDFGERWLMEWGGGMDVAWGRLNKERDLPELLRVHAWYRSNVNAVPRLVANEQASISRFLTARLQSGKPGTTVLMGHDSQMNALSAVLGLWWDPAPFPINATVPGSALRFDLYGQKVSISYLFPTSYSSDDGALTAVPARFSDGSSTTTLSALASVVDHGTIAACANPPVVVRRPWSFAHERGLLV